MSPIISIQGLAKTYATGVQALKPGYTVTPSFTNPLSINANLSNIDFNASRATYTLSGTVTDDTHVEDVYVFVSNPGAKIDGKKVFYLSNRGGAQDNKLDFSSDVPLWPGSNQITVIAREKSDVRAISTMYVYQEDAKTAQVTK